MRHLSTASRLTSGAWRWWTGELAALVPSRFRSLFGPARDEVVVDLSGTDPVVNVRRSGSARTVATIDLDTVEAGRQALAAAARALARPHDVVLRLPRHQAIRKMIEVPIADADTLHQMLGFEVDRQTPFRAEQVLWKAEPIARDEGKGRMRVAWTLVPRAVTDAGVARVKAWGREPHAIEIQAAGNENPTRIMLGLQSRSRSRVSRMLTAALSAIAFILAASSLYVTFATRKQSLAELQLQVASARREADAASRLRAEIERLVADGQFAAARKRQAPSVVETLDALTQLLPDDTWLLDLQMADGEIRMSGITASSSALVGLIERSDMFRNVRFRAPVTPEPKGGERFNLVFDLVPAANKDVVEARR